MATKTTAQVNAALAATAAKKSGATSATTGTAGALSTSGKSTGADPARGQAGWIDPIRAAGDTRFTDKYGTPTESEMTDANTVGTPTPGAASPATTATQPITTSAAAGSPTSSPDAAAAGALAPEAPVSTPAAGYTPTQSKYQQGFSAAQQSGAAAPQDAGAARSAVTAYTPSSPDTSNVDQFLSQDPAINTLMQGITQLLAPQNQVSSLMDDYKKLRKNSGLDTINQEIIDADTVINGTEDDIRNEIQTAGGLGTESQVQAMTLARNKSLLTRYNQLVQMKTDATNNLNTMMSLDQQDKQMAQTRINTQIESMFNMANFRQTALNNSRSQYQWMSEQMGADGLYSSLAKDPRQLAFAENIMGLSPGGLQKVAETASAERARKASIENQQLAIQQGQLNVSRGNLALEQEKYQNSLTGIDPAVISKLQSSSEYKTVNGLLPAVQAIKDYKDAIGKYGTFELLSGKGSGELKSSYGNALAAWKTLAGLGALSGADFELAENAIPKPGLFTRNSTSQAKLDASLSNAVKQSQSLTKRLTQAYPTASPLITSQMDDILVTSNPDKYKVGADGQVYELTDK